MLEFLLCSLVTLVPDYLFRRFAQGKRLGREINLFSVWYELRYGITACLILTVSLITVIFYYHPASTSVASFYRTVTILPEAPGRVAEVFVSNNNEVEAGDPIFRLDDRDQAASVDAARKRIAEIEAELLVAQADLAATQGGIDQAQGALAQAEDQLEQQVELRARNPDIVSPREIERLERVVEGRIGALEAAEAARQAAQTRIDVLLPAQRESAAAELARAEVALDKTLVRAGVTGTVEQFALQEGDVVSPVLRAAGILVPREFQRGVFTAGFGQVSAQVIQPGMVAEIACHTLPYRVIPMLVDAVQPVIADGQFRPTDQLIDPRSRTAGDPGTLTVRLVPLYEETVARVPPGSRCIANVYTNNHDRLDDPDLSTLQRLALHGIDTVGLVHAILLRIQVFLMPVRTLVLTGAH